MKKLALTILAITTLLFSCNSDDPENNGGEKVLSKIKKTSENGAYTIANFETNEKLINHYYIQTLMSEYTYDNQDLLTSLTTQNSFDPTQISRQYNFNYDEQGKLTSFHYFKDNGGFEDFDQDRNLNWNGNSLSVPLLDNSAITNYSFTFNEDNLISSFTLTKYNQDKMTFHFEYDANENVTHFFGFISDLFGNHNNFDVNVAYDDKVNPYYAHLHKYYYQNLILLCEDFGFSGIPMLQSYHLLGKNNALNFSGSFNGQEPTNHYIYDYDGNYPTKSYLKKADGTTKTTTEFIYQ